MWESPRPVYPNELYHYGVKGMHWGIRRYQPYPKGYSGSGRYVGKLGRVGKMSWKQINRATENAIAKSYAKDNTEEKLRRKRNLSIALGVGGAGLGLAVLGGGAINATRINNAIKLKKQKSKIKGVSNSEAESKKEKRKRILLGSAAIAGGAAALGLTAYGIKKRTDIGKKAHKVFEKMQYAEKDANTYKNIARNFPDNRVLLKRADLHRRTANRFKNLYNKYDTAYNRYDKLVTFAPTLAGAGAIPIVVDTIKRKKKR